MEMAHLRGTDSLAQVTWPPHQQISTEITVAHISPEAVDAILRRYKSFPKTESDELDELRGWLMVLATLTASITWTAALNPPGGVWQADDKNKGYSAGGSVFRDTNFDMYRLFGIFNFFSFYSSLIILVLLSINWLFRRTKIMVFNVLVAADLVSLFASFIFGKSVTAQPPPVTIAFQVVFVLGSFAYLIWLMRKPRE